MANHLFPIYREAQTQKPTSSANQGLVYNKWIRSWSSPATHQLVLDKDKFLSDWNKHVGDVQLLQLYQQRMKRLIKKQRGVCFQLKNIDPFVTGLGLPHPIENSLVWHHNLGVPYIPGSSLKGVLRTWLENWMQMKKETIDQMFGKEGLQHQVGTCLFFDVIPVNRVKLQVDVMTPHYQDYYDQTKDYPDERSEPVPIPFLTVAPGQCFLFSVSPRNHTCQLDMEKLQTWIQEALFTIGLGAKTAVGYGRFETL